MFYLKIQDTYETPQKMLNNWINFKQEVFNLTGSLHVKESPHENYRYLMALYFKKCAESLNFKF